MTDGVARSKTAGAVAGRFAEKEKTVHPGGAGPPERTGRRRCYQSQGHQCHQKHQ